MALAGWVIGFGCSVLVLGAVFETFITEFHILYFILGGAIVADLTLIKTKMLDD